MEDKRIAEAARHLGVAEAGVLLLDDVRLRAVAASSDAAHALDALQADSGVGPAPECLGSRKAVLAATASAARQRWPALMHKALFEGLSNAAAIPVLHQDSSLGVLTLYTRRHSGIGPAQVTAASRIAPLVVGMVARDAAAERLHRATVLLAGAVSRITALDESTARLVGESTDGPADESADGEGPEAPADRRAAAGPGSRTLTPRHESMDSSLDGTRRAARSGGGAADR